MRILFSIVSLLIVVGIAVWWSMQSFSNDVGLITPTTNSETGETTQTPIDQAKEAKLLIETKTAAELSN